MRNSEIILPKKGGIMGRRKSNLDTIALVLVLIGALNWGLVGLFNFDIVLAIFEGVPILVKLVYILIGLSAVFLIYQVTQKK